MGNVMLSNWTYQTGTERFLPPGKNMWAKGMNRHEQSYMILELSTVNVVFSFITP